MAGFEVLETKNIREAKFKVVDELDKNTMMSINNFNKTQIQYKSILVCKDKNNHIVVDGNKYFKSLKKNGLDKVLCFDLGRLRDGEYELIRLLLNYHQQRLSYLDIAELVSSLSDKEIRLNTISNKTGIDYINVKRFTELLSFDWDDFNKKTEQQQFNPFTNGEEER